MPIYESNRSIFSLGTYNKFNHSVKSNNILNKGLTPNPHASKYKMLLVIFIFFVIPLVLIAIFYKKIKDSKILDKFRKDKKEN